MRRALDGSQALEPDAPKGEHAARPVRVPARRKSNMNQFNENTKRALSRCKDSAHARARARAMD